MHQVYPHTAIFIFCRDAEAEASSKLLSHNGRHENLALIRAMNAETERIARGTGLPVFSINGELKPGETFGERFRAAFISVFEAGFQYVIGIGNDCPALSAGRLLIAARHLERHPFVIGPAKDGGVYLVGAQKDAIRQVPFSELPWQSSRLFEAMVTGWQKAGVYLLQGESDLDTPVDLQRLVTSRRMNAFIKALAETLSSRQNLFAYRKCKIKEVTFLNEISLRGPPSPA